MTEDEFADALAEAVAPQLKPFEIGRKRPLLYDLSIDHRRVVTMGVDPNAGEPTQPNRT